MGIKENYQRIRDEIPGNVEIVVAAKTRTRDEVLAVIDAGATIIGENYVQEARTMYNDLGETAYNVTWHMIGHVQKNKINKALPVFDVIQTIDSLELAQAIDKRVPASGRERLPVYIEINSGGEGTKSGIHPEYSLVEEVAAGIATLDHLSLQGLMTMGPLFGDPEEMRPYFKIMKQLFDKLNSSSLPGVRMKTLSMGMSHSYKVAIEEGSTMVRLGTIIFGPRKYNPSS
jgi:PLP dependent protein